MGCSHDCFHPLDSSCLVRLGLLPRGIGDLDVFEFVLADRLDRVPVHCADKAPEPSTDSEVLYEVRLAGSNQCGTLAEVPVVVR